MRPARHPDRARDVGGGRVDEGDAVGIGHRHARQVEDLDAGQPAVGDRLVDLRPGRIVVARAAQDDRRARGGVGQACLVLGRIGLEDLGKHGGDRGRFIDRVGRGDQGRPGPGRRQAGDAGQVERAGNVTRGSIDDAQAVIRGGDDRQAVLGREEVRHRVVHRRERDRLDAADHPVETDDREVDRRDPAVVEADQQLLRGVIDGQRRRTRGRERADGPARAQVIGPDLGAGRQVEALTRALARQRVFPSWLDRGRRDRGAQIACPRDVVLAPQHDARGHRVLGEVRMGPLVDVVRLAVAPVLQELHGRPGVIDLVEMRLVRLFQAKGPHPERRQQQDDQDPRVEAVQAPAAFPAEHPAAVRPHRALRQARPDPADEAAVGERGTHAPRGRGGRPSPAHGGGRGAGREGRVDASGAARRGPPDGGAHLDRARAAGATPSASATPDPRKDARAGEDRSFLHVVNEPSLLQLGGESFAGAGSQLEHGPGERGRVHDRHDRHRRL